MRPTTRTGERCTTGCSADRRAARFRAALVALCVVAACSSDDDAGDDSSMPGGDASTPDDAGRGGSGGAGSGGSGGGGASGDGGSAAPDGGVAGAVDAGGGLLEMEVSYADDVAPIFATKCNWCHHEDSPTHYDFTQPFDSEIGIVNRDVSWTAAEQTLVVDPGTPQNSFLLEKITREDLDEHEVGFPMPWHIERLTEDELDALRQWIDDGANDDAFYQDTITLIFGDGETLGSRRGKCAFCHYTGGTLLPDLVQPFDPETGAVGVTGVYGRVLI
jgi:hypothetical protein